MTSRRPYWCPKTMKRRPCWCPKPDLWELNSFLMQTLSFVPINLHGCWPREWKRSIECFHMTSRRPYWCPKTMKQRPCWCPKPVLWELNSFLMQTLSFVPINLHICWPREWKHSISRFYCKKQAAIFPVRWPALRVFHSFSLLYVSCNLPKGNIFGVHPWCGL